MHYSNKNYSRSADDMPMYLTYDWLGMCTKHMQFMLNHKCYSINTDNDVHTCKHSSSCIYV